MSSPLDFTLCNKKGQPERFSLAIRWRHAGVLGDVENADVGGGRLGGDDKLILRHVSRAVDLPVVVDLDRHLHLAKAKKRPLDMKQVLL